MLRKYGLMLCCILTGTLGKAQSWHEKIVLAGGVSFYQSQNQNQNFGNYQPGYNEHAIDQSYKHCNYEINPQIGFVLSNRMLVGIGLNARNSMRLAEQGNQSTYRENKKLLMVQPFMRYSFFKLGAIDLWGQLALGYGAGVNSQMTDDDLNKDEFKMIEFTVSPGASYYVTEHFAVQILCSTLSVDKKISDYTTFDDAHENQSIDMRLDLKYISVGLIFSFDMWHNMHLARFNR